MRKDNTVDAFFALVRAGLWEKKVGLSQFGKVDYNEVLRLAEEQAVVGVVTAGLEYVTDNKIPQAELLRFIGRSIQIEQQNTKMNQFVGDLVEKMRNKDIFPLLVKGQGIALCYERPLWRCCGDVDLYLSEDDFLKAKSFFRPFVESFDPDNDYTRHINMYYNPWVVEIHGNQHTNLSCMVDRELDKIHYDLFCCENVRSSVFDKTQVVLPSADCDIMIVFTHFIKHFYKGGLGIKQICDWCRLIWTFRDEIDKIVLEKRLKKMGLMSEWKSFGFFSVNCLGMPFEAMPFYENRTCWKRKADKIKDYMVNVGNFGHNRDVSYYEKYPRIISKIFSFGSRIGNILHHASIFPYNSMRFLVGITINGLRSIVHED